MVRARPGCCRVDERVARALDVIDANPRAPFRVRELAKIAGASRATFARLFIAATGEAPMRYVAIKRMELAASLLAATSKPLSQIAELSGYSNEFALSRAFKRHYGMAPAFYRQAVGGNGVRCAA